MSREAIYLAALDRIAEDYDTFDAPGYVPLQMIGRALRQRQRIAAEAIKEAAQEGSGVEGLRSDDAPAPSSATFYARDINAADAVIREIVSVRGDRPNGVHDWRTERDLIARAIAKATEDAARRVEVALLDTADDGFGRGYAFARDVALKAIRQPSA